MSSPSLTPGKSTAAAKTVGHRETARTTLIPPHRKPAWVPVLTLLLSWVVLPSSALAQPQVPRVSLVLTYAGTVDYDNTLLTETGVITVSATMDTTANDTVTVTLSVAPANYHAHEFATTDDYVVSENKVLTFVPGSSVSTGIVTVTGVDDGGVKKRTRRIRITFTPSSNAVTAPDRKPSSFEEFVIIDDEPAPTKSVVLTPAAISEKGGVATVTAELSHPTLYGDVMLDVQTGLFPAGTARRADAEDFMLSANVRLVVPSGETASTGTVTVTAVDNDVVGPAQKRLGVRLYNVARQTVSTEPGLASAWSILTIEENDRRLALSVDASPACGTTVTDSTVQPSWALVLTPAPAQEVATEYRWVTDSTAGRWLRTQPIRPSGRSIELPPDITFGQLRQNFPGFSGFEYRLRDDQDVTAQCTWEFDDGGTTPAPPTVRLSASPNPVAEGSSVTVTARLSSTLASAVTVPLTVTRNTSESEDHGTLSSITINAGATSGTGTISTAQDADEDDETFTVALGTLPSSVTAGTPSSVTITISDDRNPYNLGVESIPACGTMVTDMSVAASQVLVRTPPPVAKVRTEWRVLGDTDQRWLGAADIEPSGRSPRFVHNTFAELRRTFPRSAGFEYRLADVPRVTAECTWTFDDPENDGGPPIDTTTTTPDPGPPGPPGPPTGGGGGAPPPPTRSGDASLSALEISGISPDFDTDTDTYTVSAYDRDSVTVTPTANHDGAEITVNGNTVQSGSSAVVTLDEDGETSIEIVVTAEDGTVKTYTLTVMSCPGEERKILEMFYDSTQGDMWEESSEWNIEENDLRDWHGVETDEDDRVTALRLPHNTLSGEYPEALRCFVVLEELRELALWGNELSGDIPDEFALAVERAVLRDVAAALSLNPVWFDTYEDPYEFGDWHEGVTTDDDGRVTELDLTGEGIEGEIPESVFELKRLRAIETGCGVTLGVPAPGRVSVTMAEGCSDASLGNMEISPGELAFSPVDLFYETAVGYGPENITVTPETNHPRASLTINGEDAVSGEGMEITLNEEEPTVVSIEVTARDGTTTRTYKITVTRCGAEREDLVRFYEKTGGADWHENENWTSAEPLDRWFGVETDEDRSVISLRLEDNGLSGETPRELLCLSELKELALWDNDGLSGEVPQELALAVERAALRDVAVALSFKAEWFDRYEDHPYGFGDWHAGVTTDDDGRVTELDFTGEEITGEIPESVFELKRLRVIETGCGVTLETEAPGRVSVAMPDDCEGEPEGEPASSGDGGCALGSSGDSSAFALFLVTLLVFAALGRKRAR